MSDEPLVLEPRSQFDKCILGYAERFNSIFAVYSRSCVLATLAEDLIDDSEYPAEVAALEHYQYNIVGGWVGEGTPAFMLDDEPFDVQDDAEVG